MRNAAVVTPDTITPAEASGEQAQASAGRSRGASGVSGSATRVIAKGSIAAQQMMARMLYET